LDGASEPIEAVNAVAAPCGFKTLNGDQLETVHLIRIRNAWPQFPDRRAAVLQHWSRNLPPAPKMPEVIAKIAASWNVF
jgi:hypothetical protein